MFKTSETKKKYWYTENIFLKLSPLRGSTSDEPGNTTAVLRATTVTGHPLHSSGGTNGVCQSAETQQRSLDTQLHLPLAEAQS